MAKRLNKNLVVGLTLTGMMVMTIVAIWMLKKLRDQDPAIYVTQAEEYVADGKPQMALKAYLRAHRAAGRKDPLYLILAGDQAMEADESEYALSLWGTAINLDPKNLEAQRKIVEFRVEQGRITRSASIRASLKGQAKRLLELDDSQALGYNAYGLACLGLKGQDESFEAEGEENLKRATELAPDNAEYANDLAMQFLMTDRLDDAKAVFVKFLEDNPDSGRGMMRYAEFLQRYADFYRRQSLGAEARGKTEEAADLMAQALAKADEAEGLLIRAIELQPDDPQLHIAMGGYWDGQRLFLSARNVDRPEDEKLTSAILFERIKSLLETAIELDPDSYLPYLVLGRLYRQQEPPMLEEALQVYNARHERPPASRSGFKGSLNRRNQFRLYAQLVETMLQGYDSDASGPKAKKRNEEYILDAEKFLALAVSELTGENAQTHKLRGKIYRQHGKVRESINELEASNAASSRPDFETLLLLADLYLKDRQLGVAHRSVKDALAIRSEYPPAWNMMGQICLALDQPQHALEAAEQALTIDSENKGSRLLKARALVQLGREDEVGEDLEILILPENKAKSKLQQAVILQLKGEDQEAIQLVHEALALEPCNREAVRMAVLYYQGRGEKDAAIEVLNTALAKEPSDRNFMVMKVRLEEEDPEKQDARLIEIIQRGKNELNVAIQMFNFYLTKADVANARLWLDKAAEIDPSSTIVIERQFRLAILSKDFEMAERCVEQGARLNLDGANGAFMRGELLLTRGEYQRAVDVLRGAIGMYPSNSDGYVYLAAALQMTGHSEDASEALRTALEYDPTSGRAHLGLAKLADARGDREALYKYLENCEKFNPNDYWVKEQLQLKLERDDPQAGLVKREEIRRTAPENVENLVRLADLYVETGQFDNAITVADEVRALDSSEERIWFVSRVYKESGRAPEAESMLKKLVEESAEGSGKAGAQLFLARHYASVAGTPEESALAEEAYLQASNYSSDWKVSFQIGRFYHGQGQQLSDREQILKAVEWYDRALEATTAVADRAYVARYTFDALISAREYEVANERIEAYVAEFPADPRGLLYRGEASLQVGEIPRALQAFNQYLENNPSSAVGYYRRGTVHFIRSEWDKAIDDLSQAKALEPDGFGYLHRQRLATALENRRELDAAIAELQAVLDDVDPDKRQAEETMGVARLLSEMLGRNGRVEAQRALATQYKNLRPEDPYWRTVLGQNAIAVGNLFQASQHLREACKLSNYAQEPVEAAMIAWIQAGDFDQAVNFVTNEVPEDRRGPRAHLRWAQALAAKGDREGAKPHFVAALEGAAQLPELSATIAATMLYSLGQDGALEFARERVREAPDDRTSMTMLAALLGQMPENLSESLELWKSMLASATTDAERVLPLTVGAQLAYRMKEFETAKEYYEALIALYERAYEVTRNRRVMMNLPGVLNNLAYMLTDDLNQPDLALPHIERAANLVSDSPQIQDTLGWVQVKVGRDRDAIGSLVRAIELGPGVAEYHYHIAEAYAREGEDMTSAENEFQRAYELAIESNNADLKGTIEKRAASFSIALKQPVE